MSPNDDKTTRKMPALSPKSSDQNRTQRLPTVPGKERRTRRGAGSEVDLSGMSVLVADDEPSVCSLLTAVLGADRFHVTAVETLHEALAELDSRRYDILIVDKNLPDGSGLDALRWLADNQRDCATIIITAYANVRSAIEAMRLGARDYLTKPFDGIELVRRAVRRIARMLALERKNAQLVTALQATNEALASLAIRDPLTRLYNHGYLQDTTEREVSRCKRYDKACSLIILDLDEFRSLNEDQGHAVGDRVLRALADLVSDPLAAGAGFVVPAPEDVVARYGGDRFAILLPETGKHGAMDRAESVRAGIAGFDFARYGLPAQTLSIGVASFPDDAGDRAELVRNAETALLAAKHGGKNRVTGYSPSLSHLAAAHGEIAARARRLDALERSIRDCDFEFVYQPLVRAQTHEVFAYEALCRPRAEEFPGPYELIVAAEEAGKMGELGRALRQCTLPAFASLPAGCALFVNLHPDELFDPHFASIEQLFAGVADRVVLELTEFAALGEFSSVGKTLAWLRRLGFRVALDDLGAGYSGLNTLAMLEPDFVKLDMDLMRRAQRDPRTRRLVRYIVEFANDEGIIVVAEGIETEDERAIAAELGCQLLQGYLFGRGLSLESLRAAAC